MNKSELLDYLGNDLVVRVPARNLYEWIDHFWDSGSPEQPEIDSESLMDMKYNECGDLFLDSILADGIKTPCQVEVDNDRLNLEDGHHRMAAALRLDLDIPVACSWVIGSTKSEERFYAES